MEKGEVRFSGATADLLDRDDILRSVFLEGAAAAVGIGEGDAGGANGSASNGKGKAAAAAKAAKAEATAKKQRADALASRPITLELTDVTVRYGGVRAVDEVTMSVRAGEIVGLIGPNGAGKTTLFDAISGFARLSGGRIRLADDDITEWAADRRARAGLGRSFQDARIFPSLTVAENIAVALERHLDVKDPVAAAMALPAVSEAESEVALRVHDLIDLLGLGAFRHQFAGELSTESPRIVVLAMDIAKHPSPFLPHETRPR